MFTIRDPVTAQGSSDHRVNFITPPAASPGRPSCHAVQVGPFGTRHEHFRPCRAACEPDTRSPAGVHDGSRIRRWGRTTRPEMRCRRQTSIPSAGRSRVRAAAQFADATPWPGRAPMSWPIVRASRYGPLHRTATSRPMPPRPSQTFPNRGQRKKYLRSKAASFPPLRTTGEAAGRAVPALQSFRFSGECVSPAPERPRSWAG